ncbi:MAG: 2-amino-4-hydroxy-6-hydroxymethyldihydropteridine diphosphokinase, partial [Pseudomonadota bacterium]
MTGRGKVQALIGMGANIGNREENILRGADLIDGIKNIRLLALSPVYETTPVGPSKEPYLNAAALVETSLSASSLLARLKKIEKMCGRTRSMVWGEPRPLDLDILLYSDTVISTEKVDIPHASLLERDFALKPLLDLRPDAVHPATGLPLAPLLGNAKYKTIISPPLPLPSELAYTLLDHTADMGIETRGRSFINLLEVCGMCLADVMVPRGTLRESVRHDAGIEGNDPEQLLVGLLTEIIWLFDVKSFVPSRINIDFPADEDPPAALSASFFGREIVENEVMTVVKAATY